MAGAIENTAWRKYQFHTNEMRFSCFVSWDSGTTPHSQLSIIHNENNVSQCAVECSSLFAQLRRSKTLNKVTTDELHDVCLASQIATVPDSIVLPFSCH